MFIVFFQISPSNSRSRLFVSPIPSPLVIPAHVPLSSSRQLQSRRYLDRHKSILFRSANTSSTTTQQHNHPSWGRTRIITRPISPFDHHSLSTDQPRRRRRFIRLRSRSNASSSISRTYVAAVLFVFVLNRMPRDIPCLMRSAADLMKKRSPQLI